MLAHRASYDKKTLAGQVIPLTLCYRTALLSRPANTTITTTTAPFTATTVSNAAATAASTSYYYSTTTNAAASLRIS